MGESQFFFDSSERVAYDLMEKIKWQETTNDVKAKRESMHGREYYLKLFSQCRSIVNGGLVKEVLKQ